MDNIVILTGAGISAESGLGTFRDEDGLWTQYDLEEVATPQGFARNPELVHDFYNKRRANAASASPNAAHYALARLEQESQGQVTIVTQNVDNLHEAAGSENVLHMHGELAGALCAQCGHRWISRPEMSPQTLCPVCNTASSRPDIVWFGEIPYHMGHIEALLDRSTLFAAIGTSGQVYPAATFVHQAQMAGAHTIELNLEPSDMTNAFDERHIGPASQIVPRWVDAILCQ